MSGLLAMLACWYYNQPAGISQEDGGVLFDADASRLLQSRWVKQRVARARKRQHKVLTVAEMARMGGKARMAGLTREQRAELGRHAAEARWNRAGARKKTQHADRVEGGATA